MRTQEEQNTMTSYYEYPTPIPAIGMLADRRFVPGKIIGRIIKPAKQGKTEIQYLLVPDSGEPTIEPIVIRAKDVLPD